MTSVTRYIVSLFKRDDFLGQPLVFLHVQKTEEMGKAVLDDQMDVRCSLFNKSL